MPRLTCRKFVELVTAHLEGPDGRTLSVTGSGMLFVSVFAVNGGTLTELPGSPTPLPAGSAPVGIAVIG